MTIGRWRVDGFKAVMLVLFLGALGVSAWRLFAGLGAVTNLSDNTPWGLWKAVDVIVFIPLGAAGFTMAFVRYFLKADGYEFIMRRSVIWAAVAYMSAGIRLFFDIGLPWRLPLPLLFSRNFHSALLEVAWCMVLYILVLFLENAPRVMERYRLDWVSKLAHTLHVIMPAFVLGGVLLSTLHQSSLGTLYMIVGKRMDLLWYHPWLNYIFLLTAIAAGLSMAILIEGFTSKYYRTVFQTPLLARLGVAVGVALSAAFVWRIGAMAAEGSLGKIFEPRLATVLWWVEMLAGYVLPILILAVDKLRCTKATLLIAAAGTVMGMMMLRLNVVFTAMSAGMKSTYSPSVAEWIFTLGWTAGCVVLFTFFAETLPAILGRDESVPHRVERSVGGVAAAADD